MLPGRPHRETAYATAFQIQVSTDNTNWLKSIYDGTTTGTGAVTRPQLPAPAATSACTAPPRATQYGYFLWGIPGLLHRKHRRKAGTASVGVDILGRAPHGGAVRGRRGLHQQRPRPPPPRSPPTGITTTRRSSRSTSTTATATSPTPSSAWTRAPATRCGSTSPRSTGRLPGRGTFKRPHQRRTGADQLRPSSPPPHGGVKAVAGVVHRDRQQRPRGHHPVSSPSRTLLLPRSTASRFPAVRLLRSAAQPPTMPPTTPPTTTAFSVTPIWEVERRELAEPTTKNAPKARRPGAWAHVAQR